MKLTANDDRKPHSILTIGLALIIAITVNLNVSANSSTASLQQNQGIQFAQSEANKEAESLHYAYSGDSTKPGLLFIHGTPGGWGAFEVYLDNKDLQKHFFMVSVDRLGWGKSKLKTQEINGDFAPQALSIKGVMDQFPDKEWTLIGHSLGASIAPKIALIAPQQTKSLLLLAGSLNPSLGAPRWYNRAASTWVISRLIGDSMRYSNREIMGLRKQLTLMDAELKQSNLDIDVVVMQGKKDKLVSPKNPEYVATAWQENFKSIRLIELEKAGHFLPWKQTPLVIQTLYKLNQ